MKKIILSAFALCTLGTFANAQMAMRFGGEVGLNMSSTVWSPSPGTSPSMAMGARIGVVADLGITDNISIQPAIMYSMLGDKVDPVTTHLGYLQIPINVLYKFEAGPGKLGVGLTPYFGYGLSISVSDGTAPKFGSDAADYKAIDFGVGPTVSYELEMGLFFRAGYDYGLGNLSNSSGLTVHNTCIHIGAGYFFGGK